MRRQDVTFAPATPVALIAAILLPPLALFLSRGITPAFWVSVVLTAIGWLPGALFAVLCLLIPDRIPIG
jgi:uncharacterized membrane protein YqaE (UPF0057 family)